jgi:hypothetical protein
MRRGSASAALAALGLVLSGFGDTVAAAQFDIRDCPLDKVTFVDPWTGSTFAVKQVGANQEWLCPDRENPPSALCSGPFGDLVLEGEYRHTTLSDPVMMSAVWTVVKAVPCCGWSVEEGRSKASGAERFRWMAGADVPTLRDMKFLSIEAGDFGDGFGNPLFAAACSGP